MGALGPAARGAADNADEFLMIKQVACRINSAVNAGQKINDAYLDSHYTEAEQAAILDEYHSLKALQDTEDGVELVKIICSFRS